jgi:hypothetical protein
MATRFIEQATSQVAPIYDQQITQAESQIPSIQKLYENLIGGLRSESERELQTGTQGILEDASARGVLRSTLPVDARTQLQGAVSSALTQGVGNLNLRQLQDVSGINERVGNLRLQRASGIQSLAEALQAADLRERQFEMEQQAAREARAAASAASSFNPSLGYGGGDPTIPNGAPTVPNVKINVMGASPVILEQAYNDAQTRVNTGDAAAIRSDYQATASSARNGNLRDLAKLQIYRALRPDLFKVAYQWEASAMNKGNNVGRGVMRPSVSTINKGSTATNLLRPFGV